MGPQNAGCHCGRIRASVVLTEPLGEFVPRKCDCDFCMNHGAAFMSDPNGSLRLEFSSPSPPSRYKHRSGLADFWVCGECGVFVSVTYREDDRLLGSLNSRTLETRTELGPEQVVSPKLLNRQEKASRWSEIWFQQVDLGSDH